MDETTQELEARLESLYSEAEELEAEVDCRTDALQDYISDEEDELNAMQSEVNNMKAEIKEIEARLADQ